MITDKDTDLLRIGHSEIGGWDFDPTHAGRNDAAFMATWRGKTWREFLKTQWVNGAPFRAERLKEMREYRALSESAVSMASQVSQLKNQVDELAKRPTQSALAELQIAMKTCQDNARELNVMASKADVETAQEPDAKADWLTKLIAAILRRKS